MINVYIKPDSIYFNPIKYVLKIIEKNRKVQFKLIDSKDSAQLIWDQSDSKSEPINVSFYESIIGKKTEYKFKHFLNESGQITYESNLTDDIATIFFMINCIQELGATVDDFDKFGRFKYTSSYQALSNTIEKNLVEECINSFCKRHNITGEKGKSTFFISHDIDSLYGSLLQDSSWALKKMKVGVILKLILLELTRKPHWKNIDKVIKLNSEYDIRSTFFWLVNKGGGTDGIKNADYHIRKEKALINRVAESGNTNGLHKSCSTMSINDELSKGGIKSPYNRYHFLNFQTHRDWRKVSESELTFDCSLGFAEHFGFRNSYGKAFQPYDIEMDKPFDFVEAPLNFMDGTFRTYMKTPSNQVAETIINSYEKNSENCDFSLLWHNNYFTDYKYNSYLDEYKKIAAFIYENKIECVEPKELIEQNRIEW